MDNMRMLALPVSKKLFQRIKKHLQRDNMTQKEFVIGLIERDLLRGSAEAEKHKTAAVSAFKGSFV